MAAIWRSERRSISPAILAVGFTTASCSALPMKPAIAGFTDMQTITRHNIGDSQPTLTLDRQGR